MEVNIVVELINEYLEQRQMVEAMESINYPHEEELVYLIKLGGKVGELMALDRKEKQIREQALMR